MMGQLDLPGEAVLDSTIQFDRPLSEHYQRPKAILLTGATGFLGAYLLDELLRHTNADIYCLVRCSHVDEGKERLQKHLQFYELWRDEVYDRIIPVVGDLSQSLLGLSAVTFEQLATKIDVIYHSGAFVNAARSYSTLKAVNVSGTQEVLRLASLKQTKPVHLISSVSVFFSPAYAQSTKIIESEHPELSTLQGGYKQSKAVAETLMLIAQKRGLPGSIYRCARTLGHTKTGIIGNTQDLLCRMIKGCVQLRQFPVADMEPDIVPVDYISQAIIYLSQQKEYWGRAFHLLNNNQMRWNILMQEICSLGYFLEPVTYDKWLATLKQNLRADPIYAALWFVVKSNSQVFPVTKQINDAATRQCLNSSNILCPPVDQRLMGTYLSYFQKSNFLPTVSEAH